MNVKKATLFSISLALSLLMGGGTSHAQLDIFEPSRREPPPARRGYTFGPIKVGGKSGRRLISEGSRLYSQGNFPAASLKFYRIVQQMAGSRWYPTAQYQLAKTLFRMGLYRSSQHFFSQITAAGPSHPHFRASLVYLIKISRHLKDLSFLGKLTRFRLSDLPRKHRDELLYLLGRYYFLNEKVPASQRYKTSLNLLKKVSRRNPLFYAKAQYIIGAIYTLAAQPNLPQVQAYRYEAARAFLRCGSAASKLPKSKEREKLIELAILGLARIHYEAKNFRGALRYYQVMVERRSSKRWLDSMFEMAWAYLKLGLYSHTLGIIHTLDSPYFRDKYYPEVGILRAMSFFESCRYKDVKQIVDKYLQRYRPLMQQLSNFLKRYPTPAKLYGAIREINQQEDATDFVETDDSEKLFNKILNMAFKDKLLLQMFQSIKLVEEESSKLQEFGTLWTQSPLASELRRLLAKFRTQKVIEAGNRARKRLLFVLQELQINIGRALRIKFETLSAEKELLRKAAAQQGTFKMRVKKEPKKKLFTVAVNDDFVFWPFQGEYWVDELGYYRYRIKNECPEE